MPVFQLLGGWEGGEDFTPQGQYTAQIGVKLDTEGRPKSNPNQMFPNQIFFTQIKSSHAIQS